MIEVQSADAEEPSCVRPGTVAASATISLMCEPASPRRASAPAASSRCNAKMDRLAAARMSEEILMTVRRAFS
jgi:hypothetical protein